MANDDDVTMQDRREMKEEARARLVEMAEANDGKLTPEQVVEEARNPESPLHGYFEWDVEKAAAQHWLDQARSIIRSVTVNIKTETRTVRSVGFVRDPTMEAGRQGYMLVRRVRTEEDWARDALVDEFKRVGSALKRARTLAVALGLGDQIERFMSEVEVLRERVLRTEPARLDA